MITALKRFVKKGKNGKVGGMFKVLIERMEGNSKWIGEKRKGVEFAPNDRGAVEGFLEGVEVESSPLGTYWKLQKRVRETKRREVEKVSLSFRFVLRCSFLSFLLVLLWTRRNAFADLFSPLARLVFD